MEACNQQHHPKAPAVCLPGTVKSLALAAASALMQYLQLDCMTHCERHRHQPLSSKQRNFPAGILSSLSEVDANREQLFKTKNQQVLTEMICW